MYNLYQKIYSHPIITFFGGLITIVGILGSLYGILQLSLLHLLIPIIAYIILYMCLLLYILSDQIKTRCFENQSEAANLLISKLKNVKRTVNIISFTSETFFNLLSQKEIEELLDRGVQFNVLLSSINNPDYLRDDSRERYRDILSTYIKRWKDLKKYNRSIEVRVYTSFPMIRGVIIDDQHCFIGTYYYPTHDVGDSNYLFYFRCDICNRKNKSIKNAFATSFNYMWSRSQDVNSIVF